MIWGGFLASSCYSPTGVAASCLLLSWLLKGEIKRRGLFRRIDRTCETYSPPPIHFSVLSPNPIIVLPHSTLHSSASSTPYSRWLMAFPFSHYLFPFFLFFLIPPYCFQWNIDLLHLVCSSRSLGYSFNQFKYASTDLIKTVR